MKYLFWLLFLPCIHCMKKDPTAKVLNVKKIFFNEIAFSYKDEAGLNVSSLEDLNSYTKHFVFKKLGSKIVNGKYVKELKGICLADAINDYGDEKKPLFETLNLKNYTLENKFKDYKDFSFSVELDVVFTLNTPIKIIKEEENTKEEKEYLWKAPVGIFPKVKSLNDIKNYPYIGVLRLCGSLIGEDLCSGYFIRSYKIDKVKKKVTCLDDLRVFLYDFFLNVEKVESISIFVEKDHLVLTENLAKNDIFLEQIYFLNMYNIFWNCYGNDEDRIQKMAEKFNSQVESLDDKTKFNFKRPDKLKKITIESEFDDNLEKKINYNRDVANIMRELLRGEVYIPNNADINSIYSQVLSYMPSFYKNIFTITSSTSENGKNLTFKCVVKKKIDSKEKDNVIGFSFTDCNGDGEYRVHVINRKEIFNAVHMYLSRSLLTNNFKIYYKDKDGFIEELEDNNDPIPNLEDKTCFYVEYFDDDFCRRIPSGPKPQVENKGGCCSSCCNSCKK